MLKIRYDPDFNFGPALLFTGGASDICKLLDVFRNWNGEEIDLLQGLCKSGDSLSCDKVSSIKLARTTTKGDSFLEWRGGHGIWWISQQGQPQIVGLLEGLRDAAQPGHQYLEIGDPKGTQIVWSKDEYPS